MGMILMSCSGYDPLHASKTWHEFDTIVKRQQIVNHFQLPIHKEIAERLEKVRQQGKKGNHDEVVLMSMVKDGLLKIFENESHRVKTLDMFVYPGFVSCFPLEPSIHPYDGVFTGRLSVCNFCRQTNSTPWVTPRAGHWRSRRTLPLHIQ